jgi:hypothetical protein
LLEIIDSLSADLLLDQQVLGDRRYLVKLVRRKINRQTARHAARPNALHDFFRLFFLQCSQAGDERMAPIPVLLGTEDREEEGQRDDVLCSAPQIERELDLSANSMAGSKRPEAVPAHRPYPRSLCLSHCGAKACVESKRGVKMRMRINFVENTIGARETTLP